MQEQDLIVGRDVEMCSEEVSELCVEIGEVLGTMGEFREAK